MKTFIKIMLAVVLIWILLGVLDTRGRIIKLQQIANKEITLEQSLSTYIDDVISETDYFDVRYDGIKMDTIEGSVEWELCVVLDYERWQYEIGEDNVKSINQ